MKLRLVVYLYAVLFSGCALADKPILDSLAAGLDTDSPKASPNSQSHQDENDGTEAENVAVTSPKFALLDNLYPKTCGLFLKYLNSVDFMDMTGCRLPPSPLEEVSFLAFDPVSDSELKEMDMRLHLAFSPLSNEAQWRAAWDVRKSDYESGYHHLGSEVLDVFNNGSQRRVLEYRRPHSTCIDWHTFHGEGDRDVKAMFAMHDAWEESPKSNQVASASEYGFANFYCILNGSERGDCHLVGAMVAIDGWQGFVSYSSLSRKAQYNQKPFNKEYISIYELRPSESAKGYSSLNVCRYTIN